MNLTSFLLNIKYDQKGGHYYLNLPQGSTLTCRKNDSPVDANFLKQNGILVDSLLKLREDMTGIIQVHLTILFNMSSLNLLRLY
jgi:hypothetical protein